MDYLDWRGDIPFSADPFNEVDNLILSEIVYTDLTGFMPEDLKKKMRLRQVSEAFFRAYTEEELLARDGFTKYAPFVFRKAAQTKRFGQLAMSGYREVLDADRTAQMTAVTFHLPDNTDYAAFRGTDNSVTGWKEDFNLSYLPETEGQRCAVAYLDEKFTYTHRPIRVGGHSKGGNFAVYASCFANPRVRNKIISVCSNDGPGFRPEVTESAPYREMLPRITGIVPETSIVGVLLESGITPVVVKSSAGGIMQHDALTWQVLGKAFIRAEGRDETSRVFDTTVRNWLTALDDEERERFVNALFSFLEATGKSSFGEISRDRFRSLTEMLGHMRGLPKEDQELLKDVLGKFLKSGQETFLEKAKELWESRKSR